MKRYGNLFEKIISYENLIKAGCNASKGKRFRDNVIDFNREFIPNISAIRNELAQGSYKPGKYRTFTIYDNKKRCISAAPYKDRVVHHALCNIIIPIFEKTFINNTFANRKGKGTHSAVILCKKYLRSYNYYQKLDIKKYFSSIDHEILKKIIRKKIKCRKTYDLIDKVINHANPQSSVFHYYPGDNLFSPMGRKKGIPIGNLTSQYFANIYLGSLDRFIIEILKIRAYIRYVDDFVLFHDDKNYLNFCRERIIEFLNDLRLKIHENRAHSCKSMSGVTFLGYRVFRTHIRLKRDNIIKARRRRRRRMNRTKLINKLISKEKYRSSVYAWIGHARIADTWKIRNKLLSQDYTR